MKKHKFISTIFVIFVIGLFGLNSCQKELSSESNIQKDKILKAKIWFEKKYAKANLYELYKDNINAIWDKATVYTFKNGYEVILVPLLAKSINPMYRGKEKLIIYPRKDGRGYFTNVLEMVEDLSSSFKFQDPKLRAKNFSGYFNTWDLEKGFVRGLKAKNGQPVGKVTNIVLKKAVSLTSTTTPTLPNVTLYSSRRPQNTLWITFAIEQMMYQSWALMEPYGPEYLGCEYTGCNQQDLDEWANLFVEDNFDDWYDQAWKDSCIKDSTNDPCVTDAIEKLKAINENLPKLIRDFFNCNANFSMTIKIGNSSNWDPISNTNPTVWNGPEGGHTDKISNGQFEIYMNSYYSGQTNLAYAATLIHEALHAQLRQWLDDIYADPTGSSGTLSEIAEYGLVFDQFTQSDSNIVSIVAGMNATNHQAMATKFRELVGKALYNYAQASGINVSLDFCEDLAWAGCFESKAFEALDTDDKERIKNRVNAEKDPNQNKLNPDGDPLNSNYTPEKGAPCN